MIEKLPKNRIGTGASGIEKRKINLLCCAWGQMKKGESILGFQVTIHKKYSPRSRSVTPIDTLLTSNIVLDMRIRRRGVKNSIFKEVLPSPLCNPITIFQIYTSIYYTILLVENDHYYYYDSLGKNKPVS